MSITDQLSKKTAQKLNAARAPFEEDDALISRLVDAYLANIQKTAGAQPLPMSAEQTPPPRSHLPQKAFREPLLDAMTALGLGRGATVVRGVEVSEVRRWLAKELGPRLCSADYEKVAGNAPRWWHFVHWNRMMLVNEGIFRDNSPHGVWELTDAGEELIRKRKNGERQAGRE
jgi:hypothetical protein